MSDLPAVTARPCAECPWVRDSAPGWLGPMTAAEWVALAHSDQPIACHTTITEVDEDGVGDWDHPQMRQCWGAATYRSNVGKRPRNPDVSVLPADTETVFTWGEFEAHHTKKGTA